jgi:hypothetical protein
MIQISTSTSRQFKNLQLLLNVANLMTKSLNTVHAVWQVSIIAVWLTSLVDISFITTAPLA